MFERILVVCVGNICRSPMAEVVLARELAAAGLRSTVQSAGISALVDRPADPIAVELMAARGLDLSAHRARQLTPELLRGTELVLVMEAGHQRAVESLSPTARGKVLRLGKWGNFDVPDPYRRPREEFERALALIDRGVADVRRLLSGGK
jgi:protein-tyrosine phosphatase